MNSAFVGYEEFCRSRRVLSISADNTLFDLQNSYHTKTECNNCFVIENQLKPQTYNFNKVHIFAIFCLTLITNSRRTLQGGCGYEWEADRRLNLLKTARASNCRLIESGKDRFYAPLPLFIVFRK